MVERKLGAAKAISVKTLLDDMPAQGVPLKLRSEIAALFPELPASQQSELLNAQWKKMEGPEMVPVLRQIYEAAPQARYPENPVLASAVECLYELDLNRTRTLLLEEMKRPDPRLPYHTLAILPDAHLQNSMPHCSIISSTTAVAPPRNSSRATRLVLSSIP